MISLMSRKRKQNWIEIAYVLWMKLNISCASCVTPIPNVCLLASNNANALRSLSSKTSGLQLGNQ